MEKRTDSGLRLRSIGCASVYGDRVKPKRFTPHQGYCIAIATARVKAIATSPSMHQSHSVLRSISS